MVLIYRQVWQLSSRQPGRPVERGSRLVSGAAATGLPVPVVAGLRFALERGAGRPRRTPLTTSRLLR